MKRDPRLYLDDIIQAIAAIERYTQGLTKQDFDQNELVQDGVLRRLEVIGEAARHIPQELQTQAPEIPWRRIVGMRNRLTHEYFGILIDRVWNVVQQDLPPLRSKIQELREALD